MSDAVTAGLSPQTAAGPRVAVLTLRGFERHVSRSCGYEYEDAIAHDLDDALVLTLRSNGRPRLMAAQRWLSRRTPFGQALPLGVTPLSLDAPVDLFFFSAAQMRDLAYVGSVRNWRRNAGFAVCWLQEMWINDLANLGHLADILNRFDHVICSFAQTCAPLRALLKVPVTYLPWGVDTALLCPFPNPPERTVDILRVGENDMTEATHRALIDHADRTGQFYCYSTLQGMNLVTSHRAHRANYAGTLKRSRYFVTYLAKVNARKERGDQTEFGLRYLEGVAAGAVLLGDVVPGAAFADHLGWQDAVIDVPHGTVDMASVLKKLDADPDRLAAAQVRNVTQALARHDHLHRWADVLRIAGLPATARMTARAARLATLAQMAGGATTNVLHHKEAARRSHSDRAV